MFYLSRELGKLGHEVIVLTGQGEYTSAENVEANFVSRHRIPLIPPVPLTNVVIFDLQAYVKVVPALMRDRDIIIDIQHVHLSPLVNLLGVSGTYTKNILLTLHGTERGLYIVQNQRRLRALTTVTSKLEEKVVNIAGHVISISNFVRKEIVRYYGVPGHKISVVPNGIDVKEFENIRPLHFKDKLGTNTVILHVGGLSLRKGTDILIKALSLLQQEDWRLVIVGSGPVRERKYVLDLISRLGLRDRVVMLTSMNRETLKSLFADADIYVHPAIYEPQGIAILEAMASKRPIIASATGGIPEMVGKAGILVAPNRPAELARSIELLVENSEMRSRYSELAFERAVTYDWKNIATKYERTVEEFVR